MLINDFGDIVYRRAWSEVLNFEIDKWVTDEALVLLERQIPTDAFGKTVRNSVLKNGLGEYLGYLTKSEAEEQGFTDLMLKTQRSRPKELKGLKPDFKLPEMDCYVVDKVLMYRDTVGWGRRYTYWAIVDIDEDSVLGFARKLHKLLLNGTYLDDVYVSFSKMFTTQVAYELALKLKQHGHLERIGYV